MPLSCHPSWSRKPEQRTQEVALSANRCLALKMSVSFYLSWDSESGGELSRCFDLPSTSSPTPTPLGTPLPRPRPRSPAPPSIPGLPSSAAWAPSAGQRAPRWVSCLQDHRSRALAWLLAGTLHFRRHSNAGASARRTTSCPAFGLHGCCVRSPWYPGTPNPYPWAPCCWILMTNSVLTNWGKTKTSGTFSQGENSLLQMLIIYCL